MKPQWRIIYRINGYVHGEWIMWFILIGAIALTFGVDQLLELSKDMKSATDEIVYLPILIISFLIMVCVAFGIIGLWRIFLRIFFNEFYKWYWSL